MVCLFSLWVGTFEISSKGSLIVMMPNSAPLSDSTGMNLDLVNHHLAYRCNLLVGSRLAKAHDLSVLSRC